MTAFATAAARLAGHAGVLLGWRPAEFWDATPAELAGVIRALEPEGVAPPTRDEIARLQEIYPDG